MTESIFREADASRRQELQGELEALMKRTHSILYLVHKKSNTSFHQSVRGVTFNSSGWLDFDKIWFHPQSMKQQDLDAAVFYQDKGAERQGG